MLLLGRELKLPLELLRGVPQALKIVSGEEKISWNLVRQSIRHNPLIVTIFMIFDTRFVILCDVEFLEKWA